MKTEIFFRNLKVETDKKHWKIKILPISNPIREDEFFIIFRKYRDVKKFGFNLFGFKIFFGKKWKTYNKSQRITQEAIDCLKNSSAIIPIIIKQLKGRSNGKN